MTTETQEPASRRPGAEPRPGGGSNRRLASVAIVVVVAALVAMWAYVLYLAFGPGRQPPIDRLSDPAFAEVAEPRCAAALAAVDALPPAFESPDAASRADVIDEANGIYAAMLEELAAAADLAPADERWRVEAWLDDWNTHLGDREHYAEALRTDPRARLLVSEKPGEGRHITGWIDEFAKANRMPSCASPLDA